ncbi:MAG: 2-isopropylmalate synthase [Acidobacteria bacterium]|nr:2-isopropylmalate synthase [Acidobacteriota bacterium]
MPDTETLIYDWNLVDFRPPAHQVMLDDETLRDGLQSPSVRRPTIEQKLGLLHLMDGLQIETVDIGLPGAGPHVMTDVERLAREIVDQRLSIRANCAARTVESDILAVAEVSQRVGMPIECCTFIGSSPIRTYTESWSLDYLERHTEDAVRLGVREGLPVMYVTEDSTRADPETLSRLYKTAIRAGASRICIADTVGHASPAGAAAVVGFALRLIRQMGAAVGIDWHGHRDRGFDIANSIAAVEAGATRIHGAALGIGERVGNTPMDLLLVNMVLMGYLHQDLSHLKDYVAMTSEICGVPVPANYPVFGRDAFRTATGVHASAVIKAIKKGEPGIADTVYSGVPAHLVGREQEIEVGPMSGRSNVVFWLEHHGFPATEPNIERVHEAAKASTTVLTNEEILDVLDAQKPA